MRINFKTFNIPKINYTNKNTASSPIRPMAFDTFERMSFKGAAEIGTSTHSFEIKNIKNLRCPVCGLIMLTEEQIEQFVNDVKDKKGYELVDTLEKYEDDSIFTEVEQEPPKTIFRPQKQEIVDIIKDLALQYPKKNISELVDIEAQKRIDALINKQMDVVEELETYIKRSSIQKEKREDAKRMLEEYKKEIKGEGFRRFSRKSLIYDFSHIAYDGRTQEKINAITEKLPTSEQDVNSWFVKYSKSWKSSDIARKLVQQSIPTADHLVPKSKDGANSIKNYICDCSECNSKRSNLEFDIWLAAIPNFKENLQHYLQEIQDALDNGVISRRNSNYRDYIENIIETIKTVSKGKIILDMPNSTDNGKREKMLQIREAKINEITKYIREQTKSKKEKQKEIAELESHPYYQNLFMLETLEKELEYAKQEIQQSKDKDKTAELKVQINALQNKIRLCRGYIDNANHTNEKIAVVKEKIANMQKTRGQLLKLQAEIDMEDSLRSEQSSLMEEVVNASVENSKITQKLGFNSKDKSDYERYLYLVDIYRTAEAMLKNFNSKNKQKETSVINFAMDNLQTQLYKYSSMDSVKYFVNEAKISENRIKIEKIDAKLDEIQDKKSFAKVYEHELFREGKGLSIEQMQDILKTLTTTSETVAKIHELPEKKTELENLSEAISFNKTVLHNIKKHYTTMTNEEFTEQTSLIY